MVENIDNKTLAKSATKLTGKSLAKEIAKQSSGQVKNLIIMGDYLKRIVETNEERNLLAQQSAATAEEMARLAKLDKKERQRELANKRQVEKDTGVKDPVLEKMRKKKSMWFWIIAL